MLRHYLVIAWRSLLRQRLYACINIIGLSIGMAACLLIFLFIKHEYSFDRFHENSSRLLRGALVEHYSAQEHFFNTSTPFLMGPTLKVAFPEIENFVRIVAVTDIVKRADRVFSERYHLVDSTFFSIFSFPLLSGDQAHLLDAPNSVVLTERMALKYFGTDSPMGQTLTIKLKDSLEQFTVTGVAQNPPDNSSIRFDVVIPMSNDRKLWSQGLLNSWTNVVPETYFLAMPGVTSEVLHAKIPTLVKQIMGDKYVAGQFDILFQPITDIHLNTDFPTGIEPTSNPLYSYILGGIAVAILLIACINFMTLAVARAAGRAREVGIRKVAGADRWQLLKQFWGETVLLSSLSLLVALVLAEAALPMFNQIAGHDLHLTADFAILAMMAVLLMIVSLIGGSYPALVLARFRPVQVLKGSFSFQGKSRLRQSLVVIQFGLAIALMICSFTMSGQFTYLQETPIGFKHESVVMLPTNVEFDGSNGITSRLQHELAQTGTARHVSYVLNSLGEQWANCGFELASNDYRNFICNRVDTSFIPTMGIRILEGRNFSLQFPSDTLQSVIVNQSFLKAFGILEPIGKTLPASLSKNVIVGVVDDFHFASLHAPVDPLVLTMRAGNILRSVNDVNFSAPGVQRILVRLSPGSLAARMKELEVAWKKAAPGLPFEPRFLDNLLEAQYRNDQRMGSIVGYATVLVLLISCAGLFGLAAVSVVKRTKEIGVRKVLGASSLNILGLLWQEAAWLVSIACLIAWPLSYLAMQRWLADFAYRAPMQVWLFVGSGMLGLLIALGTVSYHSLRASTSNPIDSLRYE